jgi:hypothetical protein
MAARTMTILADTGLIYFSIICILGTFSFWVIDRFVWNLRLTHLLKAIVLVAGITAVLYRLLPLNVFGG